MQETDWLKMEINGYTRGTGFYCISHVKGGGFGYGEYIYSYELTSRVNYGCGLEEYGDDSGGGWGDGDPSYDFYENIELKGLDLLLLLVGNEKT